MLCTAINQPGQYARFVIIFLLTLQTGVLSLSTSCSSACGNTLVREVPEPGGKHKVIIFQRDCGATTDFVTHVALLKRGEPLSNGTVGNIFIADSNRGNVPSMDIDVRWVQASQIVITYPKNARIYKKAERVGDVSASYRSR